MKRGAEILMLAEVLWFFITVRPFIPLEKKGTRAVPYMPFHTNIPSGLAGETGATIIHAARMLSPPPTNGFSPPFPGQPRLRLRPSSNFQAYELPEE